MVRRSLWNFVAGGLTRDGSLPRWAERRGCRCGDERDAVDDENCLKRVARRVRRSRERRLVQHYRKGGEVKTRPDEGHRVKELVVPKNARTELGALEGVKHGAE